MDYYARIAAERAKEKVKVFEALKYLAESKVQELGEAGEIEAKLVPEFKLLAGKAAMLATNKTDFVDRFNAMAEIQAKCLQLESSPVAIPAKVRDMAVPELSKCSGSFTALRKIPEGVAAIIHSQAVKKWPDRKDMQDFVINNQNEAWCRYRNFTQNRDPVIQELVNAGKEKWGANYEMLVYHVDTRYDLYKKGELRSWEREDIDKEIVANAEKTATSPESKWNGKGLPPGMQMIPKSAGKPNDEAIIVEE
ncbi:MAG TPA: hypothetical protein VF258_11390 [Luteolibacter sp.]